MSTIHAQNVLYVDDLSYNTRENYSLRLPSGTQFSNIDPSNIPDLKYTEVSKSNHLYLDNSGNQQSEIVLTDAVNCHNEWDGLADKWIVNQNGISSYKKGLKGNYIKQSVGEHNSITRSLYNNNKVYIGNYGFLASKCYPKGIKTTLNQHAVNYTELSNGVVRVKNGSTYTIYNDNRPRTITTITYDAPPDATNHDYPPTGDPNVIKIQEDVYDIELCNEVLLSASIVTTKVTLSNGLCAKEIEENYYSDYQFDCGGNNLFKLNNSNLENISNNNLSLFPNPLNSDFLVLELDDSFINQQITISINSLDGKLLMNKKMLNDRDKISINTVNYLNQNGLYLLTINNGSKIVSKKFYFVNN